MIDPEFTSAYLQPWRQCDQGGDHGGVTVRPTPRKQHTSLSMATIMPSVSYGDVCVFAWVSGVEALFLGVFARNDA
jgi:hypothetical protein